jgi:hypothetical protein
MVLFRLQQLLAASRCTMCGSITPSRFQSSTQCAVCGLFTPSLVAVFALLDDAVAAHLQRERLHRRIRRLDARHVEVVAPRQRADVPDRAG